MVYIESKMPVMMCDRCDTMKNGVYYIQCVGFDEPENGGKMCRKCRNHYGNLIHIPLWYMGGCQLPKFESLINEFWYAEQETAYQNQENPSPDGIPMFVVIPPVIQYYGIRVSFQNDGFN